MSSTCERCDYALGVTFTVSAGASVKLIKRIPNTEDDWEEIESLCRSTDSVGDLTCFLAGLQKAHPEVYIRLFPEYERGAMFERGKKLGQGIKFEIK